MYNVECFQSTFGPDYNKEIFKLNILPVSFVSSFQIKLIIKIKQNLHRVYNVTHFLSPYI